MLNPPSPHRQGHAPDRKILPSWGGSVIAHGLLALLLMGLTRLPSGHGDFSGDGGDAFHHSGIHVNSEVDPQVIESSPEQPVQGPPQVAVAPAVAAAPNPLADLPGVPLVLPQPSHVPTVVGPAPRLEVPIIAGGGGGAAGPLVPRPVSTGGAGRGAPEGGTSFHGIGDVGKRFVYVIDRSASMGSDNALQAAKMELLASLEMLKEIQQFQIIFYNSEFVVMKPRGERFDMFRGTPADRFQVGQQLAEVLPTGGTSHLTPLLKALTFNPDVIFLLTDGTDSSTLTPGNLKEVRQRNISGAHIHTIEFGRAPETQLGSAGNFLKELARQNDGRYAYRQIGDN